MPPDVIRSPKHPQLNSKQGLAFACLNSILLQVQRWGQTASPTQVNRLHTGWMPCHYAGSCALGSLQTWRAEPKLEGSWGGQQEQPLSSRLSRLPQLMLTSFKTA